MKKEEIYNIPLFILSTLTIFFSTFIPLPNFYNVKLGEVYDSDIYSPFDLDILLTLKDTVSVFRYDTISINRSIYNVTHLLNRYISYMSKDSKNVSKLIVDTLKYYLEIGVISDEVSLKEGNTLHVKVGDTIVEVEEGDVIRKSSLIEKVRRLLQGIDEVERERIVIFLNNYITPSIIFDRELTLLYNNSRRHTIHIDRGEKIHRGGDVVSDTEYTIIDMLNRRMKENYMQSLKNIVLRFLITFILWGLIWGYIYYFKKGLFRFKYILFITLLVISIFVLGRGFLFLSPFLIPFFFITVVVYFLYSIEVDFLLTFTIPFIFFFQMPVYKDYYIPIFITGIFILISVKFVETKKDIYKLLIGGVLGSGVGISIILLTGVPFNILDLFYFVLNTISVITLSFVLIPLFEKVIGRYSTMTISDIGNLNHPLLKELSIEAPGTYNHSISVSLLSEAAARAIGADPYIARVGSYYHDIGKLRRPQYFIENQTGINPHKNLTYRMSALVIISHVKDGVEIARRYNIPGPIIDIIREHHGTTVIESFYRKALKSGEKVEEDYFRYPGPKPKTKESAIVMLADTVEAAIRAEEDIKPSKLLYRISQLIESKIKDNQLEDAPLTFKDISTIKKVFFNMLLGLHHTRIPYL